MKRADGNLYGAIISEPHLGSCPFSKGGVTKETDGGSENGINLSGGKIPFLQILKVKMNIAYAKNPESWKYCFIDNISPLMIVNRFVIKNRVVFSIQNAYSSLLLFVPLEWKTEWLDKNLHSDCFGGF